MGSKIQHFYVHRNATMETHPYGLQTNVTDNTFSVYLVESEEIYSFLEDEMENLGSPLHFVQ